MSYYTYKYVRDQLPAFITNAIEDYEGEPNYDGDQWRAASAYIDELEAAVISLVVGKAAPLDLMEHLHARIKQAMKAEGGAS